VTVADAPDASVPTGQVDPEQAAPCDAVAETRLAPPVTVALKTIPVAVSGPAFLSVAVQVPRWPTRTSDGAASATPTSVFGGTGGLQVTVDSPEVSGTELLKLAVM
jgi:hypothetical protein